MDQKQRTTSRMMIPTSVISIRTMKLKNATQIPMVVMSRECGVLPEGNRLSGKFFRRQGPTAAAGSGPPARQPRRDPMVIDCAVSAGVTRWPFSRLVKGRSIRRKHAERARKRTLQGYCCVHCGVALCVITCYWLFHTQANYWNNVCLSWTAFHCFLPCVCLNFICKVFY